MKRLLTPALTSVALLCLGSFGEPALAQTLSAQQRLAADIYKELVEINTVTETGDTGRAADAMAARLRAGAPCIRRAPRRRGNANRPIRPHRRRRGRATSA